MLMIVSGAERATLMAALLRLAMALMVASRWAAPPAWRELTAAAERRSVAAGLRTAGVHRARDRAATEGRARAQPLRRVVSARSTRDE
jgi:hypothetical protein